MKNLVLFSDEELHSCTIKASANEKEATLILLEYLAEVDRRRLYALRGYSSLWDYVHKALQYSESQTSDRVNAVRLIAKVPEVKKELEEGNLSLSTAAKLGSHVKREKCANDETLDLLRSVVGKSAREVERVLAAESTAPAKPDQIKVVSKETTRIIIEVDQNFLDLMKRVQELSGHPGSSAQELFKTALSDFVKRREVKESKATRTSAPETESASKLDLKSETKNETTKKIAEDRSSARSRYITKEVRLKIRIRSGDQCEYFDEATRRRCECKTKLQYDHVKAFAKGGSNEFENIRHLCSAHNLYAAIQSFGRDKM